MPHIPPLTDQELRSRIAQLNKLNLPLAAKQRMALMLMEASHGDRLNVERQRPGRREDMRSTMTAVKTSVSGVMARAVETLSRMSADEFDRLVDEANEATND
jgi:hypothetical protein